MTQFPTHRGLLCLRSQTSDSITSFDRQHAAVLVLSNVHKLNRQIVRISEPRLLAVLAAFHDARGDFSVEHWSGHVLPQRYDEPPQVVLLFRAVASIPITALFLSDPPDSEVARIELRHPEIEVIVTPSRAFPVGVRPPSGIERSAAPGKGETSS